MPGLREKTRLGPPGVDIDEFRPLEAGEGGPRTNTSPAGPPSPASRNVVFVGKLIVSKGVDLLLAAWPLVQGDAPGGATARSPDTASTRTGCGRLLAALDRGDLDDAREVARLGWALEGGEEKPLPILSAFLADPPAGLPEAARGGRRLGRVHRPAASTTRSRELLPLAPRRW